MWVEFWINQGVSLSCLEEEHTRQRGAEAQRCPSNKKTVCLCLVSQAVTTEGEGHRATPDLQDLEATYGLGFNPLSL